MFETYLLLVSGLLALWLAARALERLGAFHGRCGLRSRSGLCRRRRLLCSAANRIGERQVASSGSRGQRYTLWLLRLVPCSNTCSVVWQYRTTWERASPQLPIACSVSNSCLLRSSCSLAVAAPLLFPASCCSAAGRLGRLCGRLGAILRHLLHAVQ